MGKMFISSFYNTLIDEEEAIPTSTMLLLDEVRSRGTLFCVLTSRGVDEVLYYNHDFPFIDYIISCNGGLLYSVLENKYLFTSPLSSSTLEKIHQKFSNYPCFYYTEGGVTSFLLDCSVYKVEVLVSLKELKKMGEIDLDYTVFEYQKKYYLEFSNSSFSSTLKYLLKSTHLLPKDVFGVIGNEADIGILDLVENISVVSNASKEVKTLSSHKTRSNKKKGVEYFLKKHSS